MRCFFVSFVFLFAIVGAVNAGVPATSCPAGFTAIHEPYLIVSDECGTNVKSAGTAHSCLTDANSGDNCIMYVPTGTQYSDAIGTYKYTEPCPLNP